VSSVSSVSSVSKECGLLVDHSQLTNQICWEGVDLGCLFVCSH